jgi:hypothetical protein
VKAKAKWQVKRREENSELSAKKLPGYTGGNIFSYTDSYDYNFGLQPSVR